MTTGLQTSRASFLASTPRLWSFTSHDHLRLHLESLKLLNFDINADAEPAFRSNADPGPPFSNNVDLCGSATPFSNLSWTNGTKLGRDLPLSTAACAMSVPSWRKRKVLCTPSVFTAGNRTGLFFNGQESKERKAIPRSKKEKRIKCLTRQTM